jgi:hypothetical protein
MAIAMPTDMINMHTARLLPDGTVVDYSFGQPYASTKTGVTILPWLRLAARVTRGARRTGLFADDGISATPATTKIKTFTPRRCSTTKANTCQRRPSSSTTRKAPACSRAKAAYSAKKSAPLT